MLSLVHSVISYVAVLVPSLALKVVPNGKYSSLVKEFKTKGILPLAS